MVNNKIEHSGLYLYNFKLMKYKVYDGDTLSDCTLDLGMFKYQEKVDIRVIGIDTPEVRRNKASNIGDLHVKAGKLVRDYIKSILDNAELVWVKSYKKSEKYSRLLCSVYADHLDISTHLISKGYAKFYMGAKKQKWTDKELEHIIKSLDK